MMDTVPRLQQISPAVVSLGQLQGAFAQFEIALEARLRSHFDVRSATDTPLFAAAMQLNGDDTSYGRFVHEHQLDEPSQLLVMLAMAPRLRPDFLDRVLQKVLPGAGD